MEQKAVIILSGGVDSTTLLYDLINAGHFTMYPLIYNYGQKHRKEINKAYTTCLKLGLKGKTINLDVLNDLAPSALTRSDIEIPEGHYEEDSMKQTVVPNRNMVMISLAVSYAIGIGASFVYYGAHGGDHAIYPDCRTEFVSALTKVVQICDWHPVQLLAPYLAWNKTQIVQRGLKLGLDYSNTWTCYKGKEKACGVCGSCVERLEAFKLNGATDPIEYEVINE